MNYSKYRFTLDMQRNVSQVSIPARRYDNGITLHISLTDGGKPYFIEDGCLAVFYGRKADGEPLQNSCIIENNRVICYEFTEQTTACDGIVDCEVRLYGANNRLITSPRFIIVVHPRAVNDNDFPLSDSERSFLDQIVIDELERKDFIENLKARVENGELDGKNFKWTGEYWARPYDENQVVYYNGSAYICIKEHIDAQLPTNTEYWSVLALGGMPYELTEADKTEIVDAVLDNLPYAEGVSV